MNNHRSSPGGYPLLRRQVRRTLFLLVMLIVPLVIAGCSASSGSTTVSQADRDAAFRQIATDYAATGDLVAAQAALDKLGLANPAQLVAALAEADVTAGRSREEVEPLAKLSEALGVRSSRLVAYLAPTPAPATTAPTAVPPTATAVPEPTTMVLAATQAPPTATSEPSETPTPVPPSATPAPQKPRVIADSSVNLRSGPGRAYPVIGRLNGGQEVDIVGRNDSGDWWRLEWPGKTQAWVAGTVVRVLGAIDTVAEVTDIPAPPTAAPQPTPAPVQPTTPPKPAGPDFGVIEKRLWTVEETGGRHDGPSVHCGEKRELHVRVVDAGGNPINGVTVKAHLGAGEEYVTGHKGVPGETEFVLGGGQEVSIIRDADGRQASSDYVAGLTTNSADIPREALQGAGYCTEDGTCDAFLRAGCRGHHSWTVTFRRSY